MKRPCRYFYYHAYASYIFVLAFFISLSPVFSQEVIFPDYIYQPNIRFPEVYRTGSDQTNSVIELNSNQKLLFQFDDMDNDLKNYSYQVIHCTPDWKPSDLLHMQYMQGFESYNIFDSHFSNNTTQAYTHYQFTFPNENMRTTISGNFIMKVFETSDPDKIVFTRRFMVTENILMIDAKVRVASDVSIRNTHQEIYFNINTENITVQDYMNDFSVNIMQNNRWDNAIMGIKPQYIMSGQLKFNYTNGETAFPGGNQYRFIDLKTLQLIVEPVSDVKFDQGAYQLRIRPEVLRTYKNFSMRPDINGRFTVYNQDAFSNTIDPDYAYLYFTVPGDGSFIGKDMYLTGGFTFGQMLDTYRMEYDQQRDVYYLKMPFKQGYYNYMYAVKGEDGKGDVTPVEGSYSETENDYTIFVYVRRPGDITHKLLAVKYINSMVDR